MRFGVVAVIAISGCGRCDFEKTGPDAIDNWALRDWQYRQEITIQLQSGVALDNFPVRIYLADGATDLSKMAADAHDVRFVDDAGNAMAFEIEGVSFNVLDAWVKVPQIATALPHFWMYFGNPNAPDLSDQASDVWTEHFVGVFHLAQYIDSSPRHNAVAGNAPAVAGLVGYGRDFDGAASTCVMMNTGGFPITGQPRTMCGAAKTTNNTTPVRYITAYGISTTNDEGYAIGRDTIVTVAGALGTEVAYSPHPLNA